MAITDFAVQAGYANCFASLDYYKRAVVYLLSEIEHLICGTNLH